MLLPHHDLLIDKRLLLWGQLGHVWSSLTSHRLTCCHHAGRHTHHHWVWHVVCSHRSHEIWHTLRHLSLVGCSCGYICWCLGWLSLWRITGSTRLQLVFLGLFRCGERCNSGFLYSTIFVIVLYFLNFRVLSVKYLVGDGIGLGPRGTCLLVFLVVDIVSVMIRVHNFF